MAETAYYNGVIYTADPEKPRAEAFVVKDGMFSLVGANEDVRHCRDRVDLKGQCVIPGLVDSHCHMFAGVAQAALDMLFVDEKTKPEELGSALLRLLEESDDPGRELVAAMGIDLTAGTFSARDIDGAVSDRVVLVFSNDGHALLLNSRAMERLGIDRTTEDPDENSYFVRDEHEDPTGLVIEIPAMLRCKSLMDEASGDSLDEVLSLLAGRYASFGYTTVFEAMSTDEEDTQLFETLKDMDERGALPLRICTSFGYHGEDYVRAEDAVRIMKALREGFRTENLIPDTLKLIADGTVEEHTALLYEPYADDPSNCGSENVGPEEMKLAASLAAKEGFSVHIHAIGDKAVGRALDVLCGLGRIPGTKTVAHNQLYREEDIRRIKEAGDIFFQTTPHWVELDGFTRNSLGEERCKKQFPVGTMINNRVTVTFGSDSCLEENTANAFLGMYKVLTNGDAAPDRVSCLNAYTINGAKQLGVDRVTGSISQGKRADFVLLDRDLMECGLEDLKDTAVRETYFGGERVYP